MPTNPNAAKSKKIIAIVWSAIAALTIALVAIAIVVNKADSKNNEPTAEQIAPTRADANGAFYVPAEGGPLEPPADSRAVRADLFFDPQCPGCGIVDRGIGDRLQQLVNSGDMELYITPVAFLDRASTDQYSSRAGNAVVTVAEKSPEHVLAFIHAIYAEDFQPLESNGAGTVSDQELAEVAVSVGVSEDIASTFEDHAYFQWIAESTQFQQNRSDLFPNGFATPSLFLGTTYVDDVATDTVKVEFEDSDVLTTFNTTFENLPEGNN